MESTLNFDNLFAKGAQVQEKKPSNQIFKRKQPVVNDVPDLSDLEENENIQSGLDKIDSISPNFFAASKQTKSGLLGNSNFKMQTSRLDSNMDNFQKSPYGLPGGLGRLNSLQKTTSGMGTRANPIKDFKDHQLIESDNINEIQKVIPVKKNPDILAGVQKFLANNRPRFGAFENKE